MMMAEGFSHGHGFHKVCAWRSRVVWNQGFQVDVKVLRPCKLQIRFTIDRVRFRVG